MLKGKCRCPVEAQGVLPKTNACVRTCGRNSSCGQRTLGWRRQLCLGSEPSSCGESTPSAHVRASGQRCAQALAATVAAHRASPPSHCCGPPRKPSQPLLRPTAQALPTTVAAHGASSPNNRCGPPRKPLQPPLQPTAQALATSMAAHCANAPMQAATLGRTRSGAATSGRCTAASPMTSRRTFLATRAAAGCSTWQSGATAPRCLSRITCGRRSRSRCCGGCRSSRASPSPRCRVRPTPTTLIFTTL
eukprot:256977-Chlamydomonas_euryale.AAC.2